MRNVIHVGIDGGSFRVLDALTATGLMPEFGRLRAEAGRADLRSTIPWFTVPGWVTWMTGVRAERHGLISWTATPPRDVLNGQERRRIVTAEDIRYPTVFRILGDAGVKVVSINMPVTFPPARIDGVMVAGFPAPADPARAFHPPTLFQRYPSYRVDTDESTAAVLDHGSGSVGRGDRQIEAHANSLASMARTRHQLFMDHVGNDIGLMSVVYVGLDRLSHVAWPQIEAVLGGQPATPGERAISNYLRTLDRLIGEARRAAGDGLFLVTSDHGLGSPPRREIAPNSWLRQHGWLSLRAQGARRVMHLVTSPRLRRWVWRRWRRARGVPADRSPHVAWAETLAFAIPVPHCRAFGVVVQGGREVLEEIATGLTGLRDAGSGGAPVDRVIFCDDVCGEDARAWYPDLFVLLTSDYGVTDKVDGPVFRPAPDGPSGYHEPEGILLATGPGVRPGWHEEVSIADIAPTLLSSLGYKPPEHMDGTAIPWISPTEPFRTVERSIEPATSSALTQDEERAIDEHLRALGYID